VAPPHQAHAGTELAPLAWWESRWVHLAADVPRGARVRLGMLLAAGAVFVPWGIHWGVLLP
jgi:hypothetical protein